MDLKKNKSIYTSECSCEIPISLPSGGNPSCHVNDFQAMLNRKWFCSWVEYKENHPAKKKISILKGESGVWADFDLVQDYFDALKEIDPSDPIYDIAEIEARARLEARLQGRHDVEQKIREELLKRNIVNKSNGSKSNKNRFRDPKKRLMCDRINALADAIRRQRNGKKFDKEGFPLFDANGRNVSIKTMCYHYIDTIQNPAVPQPQGDEILRMVENMRKQAREIANKDKLKRTPKNGEKKVIATSTTTERH